MPRTLLPITATMTNGQTDCLIPCACAWSNHDQLCATDLDYNILCIQRKYVDDLLPHAATGDMVKCFIEL